MFDHDLMGMTNLNGATVPVVVEYLDLDHDGVPDAVRIRRAVPGEAADGIAGPTMTKELSSAIGIDGIPGDVQVMALR